MATPLSYSPVYDWVNHTDPANIPPSVRIIAAEDILRWENAHVAEVQRINEHDSLITNLTDAISTQAATIGALTAENTSQATQLQNLTADLGIKAAQITALTRPLVVRASTTAYTMLATNRIHIHNAGSATYTLPDATVNSGKDFVVHNKGAGTLSIAASSGNQIFMSGVSGVGIVVGSNETIWMVSDGSQWIVFGHSAL